MKMNNNTSTLWNKRASILALLGAAATFGVAKLTSPEAQAQVAGARQAPVAPELLGESWLNTPGDKPITLASRRGEVTIVQFWTFGCSNCRANLPAYERLQKQFAARGVEIIGVHTPETAGERNPENVARMVKELGITHPVLLDPQSENWRRWGQQYWPTVYVLDRAGRVRFKWEGELNYNGAGGEKKAADLIENLLREPKQTAARPDDSRPALQPVSDEKPAKKSGVGRVVKSEAEWKKILTPMQFAVLRKEGTARKRPGRGSARAAGSTCSVRARNSTAARAGPRSGSPSRATSPRLRTPTASATRFSARAATGTWATSSTTGRSRRACATA